MVCGCIDKLGNGVPFTRLRRITGYLAEASSFNNGKRAELKDRVKHSITAPACCSEDFKEYAPERVKAYED